MKDPFETLGVPKDASMEEVERAYKRLVAKYHPDRYRDNPLRELAEEKLKEINEAYDMIKSMRSKHHISETETAGSRYQTDQQPPSRPHQNYNNVNRQQTINQPFNQPFGQPRNQEHASQQPVGRPSTSNEGDDFCAGCLTGLAICYCLETCSECSGSCG